MLNPTISNKYITNRTTETLELQYDQLNHVIEKFDMFNKNEWIQLTIKGYLENQGIYNGIHDYLKKKQDQLLLLDDKKDAYMHCILPKDNYEEYRVDKFSEEFILRLNNFYQEYKYDLFKFQQGMDHQIILYELLFKEGNTLKTDAIYYKFQQIQYKLLENLESDQKLFIQSVAITLKNKCESSVIQLGLQYIKEAININPELSDKLLQYENAINVYDKCIKINPKNFDHYLQKGTIEKIINIQLKELEEQQFVKNGIRSQIEKMFQIMILVFSQEPNPQQYGHGKNVDSLILEDRRSANPIPSFNRQAISNQRIDDMGLQFQTRRIIIQAHLNKFMVFLLEDLLEMNYKLLKLDSSLI